MPNNTANPFDDAVASVVHQDAQGTATQIRNNVQFAVGQNPDQAAQYQHLAKYVGVPVETVAAQPEAVRQQAALKSMDADQLVSDYPTLAKYMTDPGNAAKSHDDIAPLAAVEQAVKALPAPAPAARPPSFGDTVAGLPMDFMKGLGGSFSKAAGSVNLVLGAFPTIYDKVASVMTGKPTTAASDAWFRKMVDPRINQQSQYELGPGAPFASKAAQTLGNLTGMMSQIVLTGGGGEAAGAAGSTAEAVGNQMAHGAKSMAFPALTDSVDTGRRVYAETGDAQQALRAAQMQYAASTAMGVVPLSAPGGVPTRLAGGFASGVASGETSRSAMSLVLPDAMQQPFDVENMLLSGLTGSMLGAGLGPRAEPSYHATIRQAYAESAKAEAATQGGAALQALGELATASRTRARDPEGFRQLVQQMTEGGDLKEVYVDANKFTEVLQQSGVTIDALAAKLPDVAAQFHEAAQIEGDIRIPVEDYVTHIAGGPIDARLQPHLKTDPDGMTFEQGQQHMASEQARMESLLGGVVADLERDTAQQADAQSVHDKVLAQLEAVKRFQPAVNAAYAALTRDFYMTMADRAGMAPSELYDKYPLTITSEALARHEKMFGQPDGAGKDGAATPPASDPKGTFSPATNTIRLFKGADLSTYLHESGHFFLETLHGLARAADAPEGIRADFDTLLKSFGETGDSPEQRLADWSGKSIDEQRAGHEQFARGFEAYLMEGKAPTLELQGLFSRFRAWLVNVYRSLANLKVELTPEVRGVMDRLLASSEAIAHAERARGYFPIEAIPKGMTDHQLFVEYQKTGKEATEQAIADMTARSLRDMQWASNAKARALKELQAKVKEQRAKVQAEVEQEVAAEPVRQAQAYLRRPGGTDPAPAIAQQEWTAHHAERSAEVLAEVKRTAWANSPEAAAGQKGLEKGQFFTRNKRIIDNEVERRMLEWERDNPKPARPSNDLEMDFIAEMFGFADGKALRKAIADAGKMSDQVERLTDQRMLEEYGELVDPVSIERAAEAAIHNEARARFTATALKMLNESPTAPTTMLVKAAQEAAEAAIAAKALRELRPAQYAAAEARANRQALRLAPTDSAAAAQAQRAALLNNQLFKSASDAVAEAEALRIYFKKFDKASVAKQIGAEYMERIREILSNYELSLRRKKNEVSLQDWMQMEYQRTGIMPAVSDAVVSQAKHWSTMTVEEFRGLGDAIRSLEHIGREQTQIILDGKRMDLEELVAEAQESMASLKHADPLDQRPHLQHATGLSRISAKYLDFKSRLRSGDAALLKMEQLFQMFDAGNRAGLGDSARGAFSKIFKSMANAESAERNMRTDSVADLRALADKLKDADVQLNEVLTVGGLPRKGRGTQWYREELLAAALNTGNWGNLKKLTEGYGWTEHQLMSALDEHLSAPEWEFVQGVWDAIGKHGPEIEALQKRQTGVAPKMVDPRAVRTRHGQYEGGYYPVVYDAFQDRAVESKQAQNADMLFENQWARPTTSKGHTVERTGYVGPIHLSLGVIARHLDQVTHDLAWREPITEANKFLSDPRIKDEIDQTYGKEYTRQLRPWLQAMANDKVFNTSGDSAWENFYRKARTNVTIMGLGFRLSTMQIHGASALATSIGEVGVKWMAKGVAQFSGIDRLANARDFVYERSPEMRTRMNEADRNVAEAISEINASESAFGSLNVAQKAVNWGKRYAFYGVAMLDMASAMPTWYGAYLKGMAPEAQDGHGMSEDAAIEYANRAVRNAHGGGGTKDLAAIQRDKGAVSMATMFYSFWNHMYNRQRDIMTGYGNLPESIRAGAGAKDFGRLLARSWWYFVVPQVIHAMLKPSPQKDDDHGLAGTLAHIAEEVALGAVSGVPFLRDLANAAVNGRSYTVTPIESAGKALVTTANDAAKIAHGEPAPKLAAKNAVQAVGYVYGLPLGQASSTGQFLWDVVEGQQDPQGLQDWWNGISHGDMKKH
jgi:hypothetical protein